jgi:hypothetical protein
MLPIYLIYQWLFTDYAYRMGMGREPRRRGLEMQVVLSPAFFFDIVLLLLHVCFCSSSTCIFSFPKTHAHNYLDEVINKIYSYTISCSEMTISEI